LSKIDILNFQGCKEYYKNNNVEISSILYINRNYVHDIYIKLKELASNIIKLDLTLENIYNFMIDGQNFKLVSKYIIENRIILPTTANNFTLVKVITEKLESITEPLKSVDNNFIKVYRNPRLFFNLIKLLNGCYFKFFNYDTLESIEIYYDNRIYINGKLFKKLPNIFINLLNLYISPLIDLIK
jgi:hypothetical protein